MYARRMSFFARATAPLQAVDGPLNRLSDLTVGMTPWMWWPASPPRRDRPYDAAQHAVLVTWSVVGYVAGDVLSQKLPEEQRSTGRRLQAERIGAAVASVALWLLMVGAWDRRAAHLRRRPWRRAR